MVSKIYTSFHKTYFIYTIILISLLITSASCNKFEKTEFAEPLKNITATIGSNLEITCAVRHPENTRIMWFHKARKQGVEEILAVNGLKITKNPKISFSVIPRSGDITESILYIFNVGIDEGGTYTCGVNTDPMILQKGTLEIIEFREAVVESTRMSRSRSRSTENTPSVVSVTKPSSQKESQSQTFCFNLPKMWNTTKQEAEKFVKDAWKKFSGLF